MCFMTTCAVFRSMQRMKESVFNMLSIVCVPRQYLATTVVTNMPSPSFRFLQRRQLIVLSHCSIVSTATRWLLPK